MQKMKLWLLATVFALLAAINIPTVVLAADTNNEAVIKIPLHQIVLKNENGSLTVKEVISFQNTGEDNFVGNKGPSGKTEVLKISLPQGYQNLKVEGYDQNKLQINPDGFITQDPVGANNRLNISFSYSLPPSPDGSYVLDKTLKYTTEEVGIFHPKGTMKVSGGGIYSFQPQNVPGMGVYEVYGVQTPEIGKKYDIKVDLNTGALTEYDPNKVKFHNQSHLEAWNSSPFTGFNPHIFTAFVVVLIISLITAVYFLRKKKLSKEDTAGEDEELFDLYAQLRLKEKRILEKLSELDKEYESGVIQKEEYQDTRDNYKKMLIKVKIKKETLKEEMDDDGKNP